MAGEYVQHLENEIERLRATIIELQRQLSEQSWKLNPDRMGGQFTQDEINRAKEWR